jgi:hypothetical protein
MRSINARVILVERTVRPNAGIALYFFSEDLQLRFQLKILNKNCAQCQANVTVGAFQNPIYSDLKRVTTHTSSFDSHRIKPKGHLVVDGQFFSSPYQSVGEHIYKQFINMPDENAVGLERVAEQAGVSQGDGGPTFMFIEILFDRQMFPHKNVGKYNRFIKNRPFGGRYN